MRNKKWIGMLCAAVLTCGMTVNAAPFDAAYYAAQNPDVAAAVGNDAAMLEMHYNTFGAAEGRMANAQDAAAKSSMTNVVGIEAFDAAYYAAQNPDVAAIYGDDVLSLYTHYINFGVTEGRAPSAAAASAKRSGSTSENPYARFATSGSSSKRHSKSSSRSSESSNSSSSVSSSSVSENHVHRFGYDKGEHGFGTHDAICQECGYEKEESCAIEYTLLSDTEHKKECTRCKHAVNESHEKETSTRAATCTVDGKVNESCTLCVWETIKPIPAVGHTWNETTGRCERCGEVCTHGDTEAGNVCVKCGYKVTE